MIGINNTVKIAKAKTGEIMNTFGDNLIVFYLDWINNFISVQAMADHYGLSFDECLNLIEVARSYYNRNNC